LPKTSEERDVSDSPIEDPQAMRARLKKLERLVLVSLGVAATAAVIALATIVAVLVQAGALPAPTTPQALEASEVVLRDERGELRARWTVQGISLADESGRMRAGMNLGPDGTPAFTLFSKEGRVRTVIGLGGNDSAGITLHDAQSRVRARLVVSGEDSLLELSNAKGDVIGRLPAPAPAKSPPPAKKERPKR
jgi:hypothetical protein